MPYTHLRQLYKMDFGLLTDLYQLTMAYGYWKTGMYKRQAAFTLFFRKPPFDGAYAISAGLGLAIDFLQKLKFSPEDIQYLGSLTGSTGKPLFDESFLNHLQRMEFSCDVDAMPEGTIAFPHQPLLRVKGPLIQCQLIETALLTLINFSSLIATKSARIVRAAQGDSVLEFGLRRSQGIDGGITAARAAYVGGCHATSNVMAGRLYGIPVKGTHAHSWVMCFDDEITSFRKYAEALPDNCIFLVDTYDTIEGVKNAITVSKELREDGHEVAGIRLDSGDLAELSKEARRMLDEAGFEDAAIVASNELDEYRIQNLKDKGATISIWGVGTRLATAYDQPALGGVYKLTAVEDENGEMEGRIKLSEQTIKVSNPGLQQVQRLFSEEGAPQGDIIFDIRDEKPAGRMWNYLSQNMEDIPYHHAEEILAPIFQKGKLVYESPGLEDIRQRSLQQQKLFDKVEKLDRYPHGLAETLYKRKADMMRALGAKPEAVYDEG